MKKSLLFTILKNKGLHEKSLLFTTYEKSMYIIFTILKNVFEFSL